MVSRHAELAVRMAFKSSSRFRLGAVIARRSRVISCGHNHMTKTRPSPVRRKRREDELCGIHAEVDALKGLRREDTQRCHVYVARVLRSGKLALARPCENCQEVLRIFAIRKVFYSSEHGWREMNLER